jgi:HD-GYP domain-containing protein (c-di-GMP phosphodiesterase class II)
MVDEGKDFVLEVSPVDLIMCFSNTTDLVSSEVANHQQRVAYIASGIAAELGFSREVQADVTLAGAIHDFGALSLQERLECLDFEVQSPHQHSESAYLLLREFEPFRQIAEIIRHHHLPWNHGYGATRFDKPVPLESHILHCADRIAVLLQGGVAGARQIDALYRTVRPKIGTLLEPDAVEAFFALALKNYFWFDLEAPYLPTVIAERSTHEGLFLDLDGLADIGRLFSHAIDFRSRFTAVHSSGSAAVAAWLAARSGMSENDCRMMSVAGHMHDFGKLAISREILDKPAALTEEEMSEVRKHPYYAHRLLDPLKSLRTINEWVSFHHERIDGKGYPFRLGGSAIPLGARIMAVGDVFTALTEDRPYRAGMTPERALQILEQNVGDGALDGDIVATLRDAFAEVDEVRRRAQGEAFGEYEEFTTYLCATISSSQQ